jgi:peptide/nickel transport system substrate-binding protein
MKHLTILAVVTFLVLLFTPAAFAADKNTLVVGVSSDIHTLDPGVSSDNYDWRQIYPCYDRLVKYKVINGKGSTEVEPQAAESWTVSKDGTVWTFKIRKGISFPDGTPLNAETVRFAFQRTLDIGKGPSDNIGAIKSMQIIDDYTLKITLKNAYGPFLQTLATDGACIVNPNIMSKEKNGDLAQAWLSENTDGSGPFKMVEWTRGQRCVLEAKPDYWGGTPAIKRVIIRFMSESADRRMALERGDIDIAENILIDQIPALEKNPNIDVFRYPSQLVEYVYLNNQKEGLKDPRVRQALCYAVDYKGIIDYVLQGNGVQMRGPVPKGMWGHKNDLLQHHRDVKKAKALLKEAGVKNLKLTLIYSQRRASWEQIALILQNNFAEIGVTLKLELMANPTLRDNVDRGNFELCLGAWSPDFADPFMFMNFWFDSDRWGLPGNRSFYKNDKVDSLIREAAVSSAIDKRIKLYNEAQEIIIKDAPYIFLYQVQTIVSLRNNVKGYVYNPMLESMYNFESISK